MRNLLVGALLAAIGCGGQAANTGADVMPAASASATSGIVGTWQLVSDGAVVVRPPWSDVWTFGGDGSWRRDVEGGTAVGGAFVGRWTTVGPSLTVDAADGTKMTGAYSVAATALTFEQPSGVLKFAH